MRSVEHALSLWRRGLSVFALPRPDETHDGKRPAASWREWQSRRPTETEVEEMFQHDANIAVVTGAISGICVVDADSADALRWIRKRLSYTPWQVRTARGFHLYYRHPNGRVSNSAKLATDAGALAIDVRGDGGFVVGPGSVHATGVVYELAGDWSASRDDLPVFWQGWVQQRTTRQPKPSRPAAVSSLDVSARAKRYLAAIPVPEIGNGSDNSTFYAACRAVRGFGLDEATAIDILWHWAGGRPGWTREWIESKVHAAARYGSEPVGALR